MDAPAMFSRKHVPEDVGLRNTAREDEGGQQQPHRDDKQHKLVLKKVKDKVKKIKSTITGHGDGHSDEHEGERGDGTSSSSDEYEEDVAQRGSGMDKGGYQEDVENKRVFRESDPELQGAPMYDSERIPAVQEVEGDDAPRMRLADLGGPVVEDPAAPLSKAHAPRGGEDIGTTDVVRDFESMTVSDDPPHVGAGKMNVDEHREAMPVSDGNAEEWKDAPADTTTYNASGGTYTDRLKNTAAGTTELGKKLASTVYEKVAGVGTVVAGKVQQVTPGVGTGTTQDDSNATAKTGPVTGTGTTRTRDVDEPKVGMPVSGAGGEKLKDAATDAATDSASGATYTDKIKTAAAGTTEYGKKLASTVYEKVAGAGTAVAGKAQQAVSSAGTATPGVGAQGTLQEYSGVTVTPGAGGPGNGQDKRVTGVTAYISEMLRPGDEERSLSEAITGTVQQRKEGMGSTVAKAREAPAQAMTRAREAVTSLTGGNRVSETVQPTTEGNFKDGVAVEGPELRGVDVGGAKTNNTNIM